jgi:hypothetical protein
MATSKGSGSDGGYDRCGALKKQQPFPGAEDRCTQAAGWGTDHSGYGTCKLHGGNAPGHRVKAQRTMAAAASATYGLPVEISPTDALMQEVWRTQGHVTWLAEVVKTIDQDGLVWGLAEDVVGGKNHGKTFKAAPNIWLTLYQSERKHLAAVTRDAIKAGIEQSRLELEQQRAAAISTAFFGTLDALGLTEEQRAQALDLFPQALEAIGREGNN